MDVAIQRILLTIRYCGVKLVTDTVTQMLRREVALCSSPHSSPFGSVSPD